jgi:hypothetical protein
VQRDLRKRRVHLRDGRQLLVRVRRAALPRHVSGVESALQRHLRQRVMHVRGG